MLFREKHPETQKNSNRIKENCIFKARRKVRFVFRIIDIEFRLDYWPIKIWRIKTTGKAGGMLEAESRFRRFGLKPTDTSDICKFA
ncbi:MAG: hypothetical protein ACI3YE_07275, partial [Candidatus Avispirillum sp.]